MIFIDSLYINNSGGLRLLEYLIRFLQQRNISFHLLADKRCEGLFDMVNVEYKEASLINRYRYYKNLDKNYSAVLCFGNIPPSKDVNVPVYTYFHNINLLTLAESYSFKAKMVSWLKRQVFRYFKNNTDFWLVQTSNTAHELVCHLHEKNQRVKIFPFYELPPELTQKENEEHGEDYVFVSNYTGAKGHEELLESWRMLHKSGIDKTLHLTVPFEKHPFVDSIIKAQEEGIKVINHGHVSFDKVVNLYHRSKAIIYPSHNESLGLGIIEAVSAGCDVIGADLPYIYAVCNPSVVFNPYSPESIAKAVIEYEGGNTIRTNLKINNKIDDLVSLIISNEIN